jgi:fibronectin type 3 domain-containing protein
VQLAWTGPGARFRIFRSQGEATPAKLDDTDKSPYIDTTAAFGMTYRYFVQALDGEARQSEVSDTVSLTPIDQFAPAVPANVSAVAGVATIELSWDRNTEADFAGYNIYRSENGGAFDKISGALEAGNESARSMAVEAVAP